MKAQHEAMAKAVEMILDNKGKMPSRSEQIELERNIPFAAGNVRVETFDALTGKTKDLEVGHNFLSMDGVYYLKRAQKYLLGQQCPNSYACFDHYPNRNTAGLWNYLYLSDSGMADSPTTEKGIPGGITGFATKFPYTGTNVWQGTVNQNESFHSTDLTKWVFDFSTDRANGTIQSVGLCRNLVTDGYSAGVGGNTDAPEGTIRRTKRNYDVIQHTLGQLWGVLSNTAYKINVDTLVEEASYTLAASANAFVVSGNYIFYHNGSTLYRYDTTTGTNTTLNTGSLNSSYPTLCTDDTYVYLVDPYQNTTYFSVRRVDIATLATSTKTPPTLAGYGKHAYYTPCAYNPATQEMFICLEQTQITNVTTQKRRIYVKYDWVSNTYDVSNTFMYPELLTGQYYKPVTIGVNNQLYLPDSIANYYNVSETGSSLIPIYVLREYVISDLRTPHYRNMITRKRLAAPIIKDNTKTLKVTYDIIYS